MNDKLKMAIDNIVKRSNRLTIALELMIVLLTISFLFNCKQYQAHKKYVEKVTAEQNELVDNLDRAIKLAESYKITCEKYEYCVVELEQMVDSLIESGEN